ncbi:MAG: hypothetical protein HFH85_05790 [Lachnospiraceae bacterium]|nr:hypothetical protein [Lachnospiraceae bacterium]
MKYDEFVTQWALKTIRENYADDISLAVSHTTLSIDGGGRKISYYVPRTKKGEELARTFILGGVGYDIWCVSWERLEQFAELKEYNITCLADAELLYARTEEDRKRFLALRRTLAENLHHPVLMRSLALEAYAQAKSLYSELLFAREGDVKMGAGYVLDYLAKAVAFTNHTYFKHAQTAQPEELARMPLVPDGFTDLYLDIIRDRDEERQKEKCYRIICMVQDFLLQNAPQGTDSTKDSVPCPEHHFQDLADWYGELSYTWLRLRHYTSEKDAAKSYMWGIYLQSELNQVCGDFGLRKMDLMSAFDAENLQALAERADCLEQEMRRLITEGGGRIHEYAETEDFLNEV